MPFGIETSDADMGRNAFDGYVSPAVRELWSRYYPDSGANFFSELVAARVRPADHVLEIGAGSGQGRQQSFELRGKVARYTGIDPDPRVLSNPFLDESRIARADSLPFDRESFDVVFHTFVAEHFESPLACNREIARVLKRGGLLLFQTPSRYYYPMLVARITPHWFHEFYVGRFGSRRAKNEIFPTYYRLNDGKCVTAQLQDCGFECTVRHISTPPGYLRFSSASFLAGVLIERTLERAFPALRARLIVEAKKMD